ncbi:restriction endonuclease subunit S [Arcicella sp. DC2W]|uniref:Restriction endonuclease subunit S n=1 Tax=Arcicella gelida TaxID=2984195 RepID=A0ABU5S432_9BACT|nr:restriction endonuclease subunit S [Arcicella sp. DC2W]MEA5403244.1 restriction endonuclease subunit S [Arcicella sp. DC2W]
MNNTVVHTYKQTEIGIIPEDWEIGNMLTNSTLKARIGWQGLTTSEYLKIGNFYLVTGTDFFDGKIKWETCHFVEEIRYTQDRNIQLRDNDILVTKDGTIGKVAFVDKLTLPATLNSGVFVIRPKNNAYLPHFLFYILKSFYFDNFLNQLVAGSTIQHLYQKDFVTFNFVIPPLAEQTAIATALSDADALIGSLETLIAKKRNIKQGAMQQLLQPKESWEVKTLGEIANVVGGGTPSTFVSSYWNGTINWFTPTEIGDKKYIYESLRKITKEGFINCSGKMLPKGTVLLTARASIGDIGILMNEACTNQGFQSLIAKDGYNNEFIYYLLTTLKNVLLQNASGSTFLEISPNKIKQIEVSVPNINEQIYIAKILGDMDSQIQSLETKLEKYRNIKQGMMQNLLTGKIRLI